MCFFMRKGEIFLRGAFGGKKNYPALRAGTHTFVAVLPMEDPTLAINQHFFAQAHTKEIFLVIHTDTQVFFGDTLDTQVEKLADTH